MSNFVENTRIITTCVFPNLFNDKLLLAVIDLVIRQLNDRGIWLEELVQKRKCSVHIDGTL
jgi:hypothetical protein